MSFLKIIGPYLAVFVFAVGAAALSLASLLITHKHRLPKADMDCEKEVVE